MKKKDRDKMSDELKDILSNLNKDIEQEKLLEYLNRNMPDEARHELEKQMNDDPFVNDAVEGLEQMKNKKDLLLLVQELNANLKKQTDKKKKRKERRALKEYPWIYFTLIFLLLLLVIAFIVIMKIR